MRRCSSKSNNLESLLVIVELDVETDVLLEVSLLLLALVDVAVEFSLFFCCLFIISSSILIRSSNDRLSKLVLSKLAVVESISAIVSAIGFVVVTASSKTFSSPYSSSSSLWPISALKLSFMLRISTGGFFIIFGASPFFSLVADDDDEPFVLGALFFSSIFAKLELAKPAKRGIASQTSPSARSTRFGFSRAQTDLKYSLVEYSLVFVSLSRGSLKLKVSHGSSGI